MAVNTQIRHSYIQIDETSPSIYGEAISTPPIADSEVTPVLGIIK